jgi:hypothetical protein
MSSASIKQQKDIHTCNRWQTSILFFLIKVMNLTGRVKNDLIARVDELKIRMIRRLNI